MREKNQYKAKKQKSSSSSEKTEELRRKMKEAMRGRELDLSLGQISQRIMREARAIGLTLGESEIIEQKVRQELELWLETKDLITQDDLDRFLIKVLRKYHTDLAYAYENSDKII